MPPEILTRATLRSAEFGFLGVVVYTRVQTPRRCGAATFFLRPLPDLRPGVASFLVFGWRPLRTSWEALALGRAGMQVALERPGGLGAAPGRAKAPSGHRPGSPSGRRRHQAERPPRRAPPQAPG